VTVNSVKISGTDPSDFAITGGNCPGATLNGGNFDGNYCYVSVEFVPTATGSRAATLTVTDTAVGATQTVALSGTGM
jgi:hypothetical protein